MTHFPGGRSEFLESLNDCLPVWAGACPDRLAFEFIAPAGGTSQTISYGALQRRVQATAGGLQERLPAGERLLLMFPAGLDFLVALLGCFQAGLIAVPVVTPHHRRSLPRLLAIQRDCSSSHILTTADTLGRRVDLFSDPGAPIQWLTIEDLGSGGDSWRPRRPPGDVAFIQYTSGSTGEPKGVILSHRNLIANLDLIAASRAGQVREPLVCWLPAFHDWGLIGFLLNALYSGAPCTFMDPISFLERPVRWLEAIGRTGAQFSGGPNFAYQRCIERIPVEQRGSLDLSRWGAALVGAEPIHAETLAQFAEAFEPAGFRAESFVPCYGLAESTLWVSGSLSGRAPTVLSLSDAALGRNRVMLPGPGESSRTLVGCGAPVAGHGVSIVDPETGSPRPLGRIGEIWVRGPSVAQGYWRDPVLTAASFEARLNGSEEGPFLRTGDLGFLWSDQVFVTGRLKDLIIIAGRNVYPQDIERSVAVCHPDLRRGHTAAFSISSGGEEHLVVIQEVALGRRPDLSQLIGAIQRTVMQAHGLSAAAILLVRPGAIPMTSSGKVRRRACREQALAGAIAPLAGWENSGLGLIGAASR